jgi:predicted dehydrogenase
MGEKVIVGIIGTGQIGKHHIRKYQEVPNAELAAVCDVNEAEAKRVAEEFKIPKVYTDFRKLLADPAIRAVDVCLHNNFHAPVAIAAMEAGKDVYCEKPLAGSYADAARMLETAKKTGRKLSMQLSSLFGHEMLAARKLIDEGLLGRIYYAKSSFYRRRGRPYVDGYGTSAFVKKETASGGALFDMGVYHICQVLHLLDNPEILTVSGSSFQETAMYEDRRKSGCYDVEELAVGLVRLKKDVLLFIEEAWAIHLGGTDGSKIAGAKGGLTLNPFTYHSTIGDMEMNGSFDLQDARTRWTRCDPSVNAYNDSQTHWIAALRGEVPLLPTAELGLAMMLIAEGIYLSNKLGREVTADEIRNHSVSTARSV